MSNEGFILVKKFIYLFLSGCFFVFLFRPVWAQGRIVVSPSPEAASDAAEATESAEATPSAEKEEEIAVLEIEEVEKKDDITEPTPEIKGKLERYLAKHPIGPLTVTNFLQHAIREVIKKGVPANTIVLILLFPLMAGLIAGSRHIVGIKGFGIFLPAVLSVVFVSTGIIEGLLLFLTIIIVATSARMFLRKMKLQYLPRMALLLWCVSLGVLGILFIAPVLNLTSIMTLSIFPILILILLADSFIGIQIGMSMKQAIKITMQTLIVALVCSSILQLDFLQKFVLLKPEITVLLVAILDIFMGKYAGLRWLEHRKFREILK